MTNEAGDYVCRPEIRANGLFQWDGHLVSSIVYHFYKLEFIPAQAMVSSSRVRPNDDAEDEHSNHEPGHFPPCCNGGC